MSWKRPNIGSRVSREVHARFWERAEVKFLRATRHSRLSSVCQCARHVRYCSDSYQIGMRPHLQRTAIGDTSCLRMRQQPRPGALARRLAARARARQVCDQRPTDDRGGVDARARDGDRRHPGEVRRRAVTRALRRCRSETRAVLNQIARSIFNQGALTMKHYAQSADGFRETPPSAIVYAVPEFICCGMSDEETLNAHVLAQPRTVAPPRARARQ
jgi:hypothetical protein